MHKLLIMINARLLSVMMAEKYIKDKKPAMLAVCFDQLDHTGHAVGHDTPGYYEKLKELDGYVGRIIAAIKEAGIYDDTIIMMTADHGGRRPIQT